MHLDCKYGALFTKMKKVGIILATRKIPKFKDAKEQKAFDTRVVKTEFDPKDVGLIKIDRLAKTFSNCIKLRPQNKIEKIEV